MVGLFSAQLSLGTVGSREPLWIFKGCLWIIMSCPHKHIPWGLGCALNKPTLLIHCTGLPGDLTVTWPPNASLFASLTCRCLRLLASPFDQGLKFDVWNGPESYFFFFSFSYNNSLINIFMCFGFFFRDTLGFSFPFWLYVVYFIFSYYSYLFVFLCFKCLFYISAAHIGIIYYLLSLWVKTTSSLNLLNSQ